MLLAVDIGNTNVTIGAYREGRGNTGNARGPESRLLLSWRLASSSSATADEFGIKICDLLHYSGIDREEVRDVAMASVVPLLTCVFEELCVKYFRLRPWIVGQNLNAAMPILYDNPAEVGADRIVNAAAAHARFGGPCIVVDFGTATTFDCVTARGEYAGGVIAPGPVLAAEGLSLHTAKLPKVDVARPARLIGKSTVESIRSGLYFGYLELVDGMVRRLKSELGRRARTIATGGLASLICADSREIRREDIFPDLTLDGIALLYEGREGKRKKRR